ncbi:GGDEF domain-containing protein [Colwellia psychrerythraea]|uniref:diguanylate cyclase n=1 Tax=Colwellia psychrerythraea TaxID=28229 RepID=A0A099KWL6_COLPS|nr:GGDEF domain-containing protein [Colwellia psychrerythraea]KGJ94986.1 diguanylate cyclase with TPR repeat [Colwellia psychrerythraea]
MKKKIKTNVLANQKRLSSKFFFVLIFLCFSLNSYGYTLDKTSAWMQNPLGKIDELNKKDPALALAFSKKLVAENLQKMTDFDKATLFSKMAQHNYILGHYRISQGLLDKAYALKTNLKTDTGISMLLTQGGIMDELGNSGQAMEKYLLAEKYAKANENSRLLADSYAYMAYSYSINHKDTLALKHYHQAYLQLEKIGDELGLAYLKAEMANSYSLLFDDINAVKLAKEASDYFKKHQYYFDELFVQTALAKIHLRKKDYSKAEATYLRVIELTKKTNQTEYVYLAYLGLADTYHHSQQHDKARIFWHKYKGEYPDYENPSAEVGAIVLAAKLEIADNNIKAAIEALTKVEAILAPLGKQNALSWYIQLYDLQGKIAITKEDYKTAYFKQEQARELLKNYYNAERETVRSKYKVMFDTDQAILKNKLLEQDKALNQASLESAAQKQKLQNMIIIVISLFVFVLVYFMYRQILNSKALNKIANTDSLTELANRRFTFIYAEKMLLQANKNEQQFSMVMFDVDHFKQVNDNFGHSGGDIALKELTSTANEYVRCHDILGRIGGEEFLLILPEANSAQAYEIAERIKLAIEHKVMNIQGKSLQITASFGIAQLTKTQNSFSQIFNNADMALYQAKNQGRNQIVIAKQSSG